MIKHTGFLISMGTKKIEILKSETEHIVVFQMKLGTMDEIQC